MYDPARVRCTYDVRLRPDCVTAAYDSQYAPAYAKPYSVMYPYYPSYEYNSVPYQVMITNDETRVIDRQDSVFLQYLMNSLGAIPLRKK